MKRRILQYLAISGVTIVLSFLIAGGIYFYRSSRGLEEFLHVHLWVSFSFAVLGGLMVRGSMMGPKDVAVFSDGVRHEYKSNRRAGTELGMEIFLVGLTCVLLSYSLNKKFGILRDNPSSISAASDTK